MRRSKHYTLASMLAATFAILIAFPSCTNGSNLPLVLLPPQHVVEDDEPDASAIIGQWEVDFDSLPITIIDIKDGEWAMVVYNQKTDQYETKGWVSSADRKELEDGWFSLNYGAAIEIRYRFKDDSKNTLECKLIYLEEPGPDNVAEMLLTKLEIPVTVILVSSD